MEMKKTLPISMQSDLNGYLLYAYPYCVLDAYKSGKEWLQSHYFKSFSFINEDQDINLEFLDGITYGKFYRPNDIIKFDFQSETSNIFSYITSSIDEGRYIIIFVDEYHRPGSGSFNRHHFLHELMIYGYEGDELIYLAFNRDMQFMASRIDRSAFEKAYHSGLEIPSTDTADWVYKRRITDMTYLESAPAQPVEAIVQKSFKEYKNPEITNIKAAYKADCDYVIYSGIENTKLFLQTYDQYGDDALGHIPYAGMHILYESKKLLLDRIIKFNLIDNPERYRKVVDSFNSARMLYLKGNILGRYDLNKIFKNLSAGYELECELL